MAPGAVKILHRAERDNEMTSSLSAAAPHPHLGFIRGAEAARERLVWDFQDVIRPIGTRDSASECGGSLERAPDWLRVWMLKMILRTVKLHILCFIQMEYAFHTSILCL